MDAPFCIENIRRFSEGLAVRLGMEIFGSFFYEAAVNSVGWVLGLKGKPFKRLLLQF
ncbi:MAG: hypothetical protein ACUVTE_06060 [Candidatus Bathycorpusculaceae bacterium]